MSGQAGAQQHRRYFSVFLGSGINEDVAMDPSDPTGDSVADYFRSASQPYERWLLRAAPALDTFFERLAASGTFPICDFVPMVSQGEPDSSDPAEGLQVVNLRVSEVGSGTAMAEFQFRVREQVAQPQLDALIEPLRKLLKKYEPEPDPAQPAAAPAKLSPLLLLRRILGRLRRSSS